MIVCNFFGYQFYQIIGGICIEEPDSFEILKKSQIHLRERKKEGKKERKKERKKEGKKERMKEGNKIGLHLHSLWYISIVNKASIGYAS